MTGAIDTERYKPQKERDNFLLHCNMVFWSVNGGVSFLTTDLLESLGSVRKGLLAEFGEDLVRDSLSNSGTIQE